MSKVVVISQSMYLPWCGFFDLMRLANVFVHYDDVQLARGFYYRVQLKSLNGPFFISIPLKHRTQKQLINESVVDYADKWVENHRNLLLHNYRKAPHLDIALKLFDSLHSQKRERLHEISRQSIKLLASFLKVDEPKSYFDSADLDIGGHGSGRLLDITKRLGGTIYLSGHGGLNYLDHELFERNHIEVRYMRYRIREYAQVGGDFTPYVSALDAIAHLGTGASNILLSETVNWRIAIERPDELRA